MEHVRGLILTVVFALAAITVAVTTPAPAHSAGKGDRTSEAPVPEDGAPDGDAAADAGETSQEAASGEVGDTGQVEVLLDRLSRAESEREAEALERRIVAAWNHSGSDTVDLLLSRAAVAVKSQDYGLALQYLDTIVETKPDFAEGWNMRATVYYLIDEYELSLADIQHVLALQPRHFGALSGLGMIFQDLDEPAKALDAFRQVLSVHPYFGNARESVEKLEPEVEGREI